MSHSYNLLDNVTPEQVKRYLDCGYTYMITYEKYSECLGMPVQCRFPTCGINAGKYVSQLINNGCQNVLMHELIDYVKKG